MDHETEKYDAFMRAALCAVHGRFPRKCAKRSSASKSLLEEIVARTVKYQMDFNDGRDNVPYQCVLVCDEKFTVLGCALRRMGLGMQSFGALAAQVRIRHVRKHSAYEDFARECCRNLETPFLFQERRLFM
jgi:hypothetical protein